jgi:hypothetical protein
LEKYNWMEGTCGCGSGYGGLAGCFKRSNKPSGFIKMLGNP